MPQPRSARHSPRSSPPRRAAAPPSTGPLRLQRYLAAAGLGSRRHCEEYISAGRVAVDGEVVTELGATVDPNAQSVTFDGEVLRLERKRYFALYKPAGFLTTHRDPQGRRNVTELFPPGPRLFAVGRLDENSEGLLLVTNDGDLGHKLAHPRYRIDRTYVVQVAGHPAREVLEQMERGMFFAEGKFQARSVKPIRKQGKSTFLEVRLREGRNREIRRLFARTGHKVLNLQRTAFGPVRLGRLKPGEFRELTPQEVQSLRELVAMTSSTPARQKPSKPPAKVRSRRPVRPAESPRPASAQRPRKRTPRQK